MRQVQEKERKEKRYEGKKCPFCYAHLQERDELVGKIVISVVECIECGDYFRVKGD